MASPKSLIPVEFDYVNFVLKLSLGLGTRKLGKRDIYIHNNIYTYKKLQEKKGLVLWTQ